MKSCGLSCTAAHQFCGLLSQFFEYFSSLLKLSFALPETCLAALFGIVSSPFSNTDSIQFTTLFSDISPPFWPWLGCSFAIFFAPFFWLLILVLCRSLSCSAPGKLYLNVRSTFPIVCWRNKYKWVFFSNKSCREKMAFLRSPVRLTSRHPPSSTRVCADNVRLVALSYANVITKFSRLHGLPILLTNGASLARLARRRSAIMYNL